MQITSYSSTATTNFPTLAEATWQSFSPFLSRYQWAFDDPSHSPRAAEITSAIRNRGKKGCCTFFREEGYKYVLPVMHVRHFEQAIARKRRIYYVSHGKYVLLYFDIDLHCAWQTLAEGLEARQKISDLFARFFGQPVLFWSDSCRGMNGYLKVALQRMPYDQANSIFERLEKALQRFLAYCDNLADFEVKGRIGYLGDDEYTWKQYGKLPLHQPGWNFKKLEEFKATPMIPVRRLSALCRVIESQIPAELLDQHKEKKKALGDTPIQENDRFLVTPSIEKALLDKHGEAWQCMFNNGCEDSEGNVWLGMEYYRPGRAPLTGRELREERQNEGHHHTKAEDIAGRDLGTLRPGTEGREAGSPRTAVAGGQHSAHPGGTLPPERIATTRHFANVHVNDLTSEPDSFQRQKEALFRLARRLKRVPTLEEALQFIKEERLFSGSWEERRQKRKVRVKSILKFISRTFDLGKCAKGSVNVGKYDAWAAKKFPHGFKGRGRKSLTEDGEVVEFQASVRVSPQFITIFMAVCEFGLLIDKNKDGTLPQERAKRIWEALYAKGLVSEQFCARKWAICREELARHGVIKITNRLYGPGKAMEWAVGTYFPGLGLWKTPKRPSLLGPGDLVSLVRRRRTQTTRQHNTLLRQQSCPVGVLDTWRLSRPPPVPIGAS
jgi:hypothetical protein